eukprot:384100-Pelagomonas_calceolata.AAC.2
MLFVLIPDFPFLTGGAAAFKLLQYKAIRDHLQTNACSLTQVGLLTITRHRQKCQRFKERTQAKKL